MSDSDDKDSKTEQASDKRIQDSIDEGKVPVSREVGVLMSFGGLLCSLIFFLPSNGSHITVILSKLLDEAGRIHLNSAGDVTFLLYDLSLEVGMFLMPIVLILMIGGILASVLQNPPQLVLSRIMPTFSRISPMEGWNRLASINGLVEFGKSLAKLIGAGIIVLIFVRERQAAIIALSTLDVRAIPGYILEIIIRLLALLCVVIGVIVAADVVWSRIRWRQDMRMTKQEIKDERKQMEGDPMVKARLRSVALMRARKRMMAAVPRATLVVANPTHFAVALYYEGGEGGAPKVLAKGQDFVALRIRAMAEKHGVPVFEDKALARSLYAQVEVDQMIPAEFYRAVARLITFLNKKKDAARVR
eukprot:gene7296-7367_t